MIYLDHNATSPVRNKAVERLLPYLGEFTGNPSSVHGAGRAARKGLDEARRAVARLVDVHESQIIFTSGGTEANNLALMGAASSHDFQGHIITTAIEHPSVLRVCELLSQRGVSITLLPVDKNGIVDLEELENSIRSDTFLVSIMHSNNETGVLQPFARVAEICRNANIMLHSDTVQSVGKLPVTLAGIGAGMLSISAHKFGGPKGVGALVVANHIALPPMILGGGQERNRRAGTENLPAIVGFGAAAELVADTMAMESVRLSGLRNHLELKLSNQLPGLLIFGKAVERLPNTTAVGLAGLDGETLVMNMDLAGFAISAGSACGSGRTKASHVLSAMGFAGAEGQSAVRISLGWNSQQKEVDGFVGAFVRTVKRLQEMSFPLTMAV